MAKLDLDLSQLEDYERDLLQVSQEVYNGKYAKAFLRNTGNKAKRRVRAQAVANVKYDAKNNWTVNGKTYSPTGNLFKGQKRGRVYKYTPKNSFAVRVFGGAPAYHSNWMESGHEIILPNGQPHGRFEGYGYFSKGMKDYEPEFYKDVEYHVVDKILKKMS